MQWPYPRLLPLVLLGGAVLAPPLAAQQKTSDDAAEFLRYVEEEEAYPQEDLGVLRQTWNPRLSEDPIQDALRLLDRDYRGAAEAFEQGQDEEALKAAVGLIEADKNPYVTAYARLLRAKVGLDAEDPGPAMKELEEIWATSRKRITADHEVKFYMSFVRARLYERDEAIEGFQEYLEEFPDAPERYKTLARELLRDLLLAGTNPLLDVAGQMGEVKVLLRKELTNDPTQEKQQGIVAYLKKIIALVEELEKQGGGGGGGSGGGRSGQGGAPSGNRQSNSPAQNSALPQGPGREGPLRRISRGKPGEAWGDLKGKDREEVIQAIKARFPGRYSPLLDQYYKALSEGR